MEKKILYGVPAMRACELYLADMSPTSTLTLLAITVFVYFLQVQLHVAVTSR